MARYIDADKFLGCEIKRCGCVPLVGSCTTDNESLAYQLAKAPTADVVEVVRCKDCKHWKKYENTAGAGNCKKREFCFEYGNEHTFNPITMPDFYCSYGERKQKNDFKE